MTETPSRSTMTSCTSTEALVMRWTKERSWVTVMLCLRGRCWSSMMLYCACCTVYRDACRGQCRPDTAKPPFYAFPATYLHAYWLPGAILFCAMPVRAVAMLRTDGQAAGWLRVLPPEFRWAGSAAHPHSPL